MRSMVSAQVTAAQSWSRLVAPIGALVLGSLIYGLLVGGGAVRFAATPLILGIVVVGAGLVGTRRRIAGSGLVLTGWGAVVLLVDHGVVAVDRTTPAYMLGIAAGMLTAAALAPRVERADWLVSAAITSFTAPLSLYLASDIDHIGRWPLWSTVLLGWAAWEGLWGWACQRQAKMEAPRQGTPAAPPTDTGTSLRSTDVRR